MKKPIRIELPKETVRYIPDPHKRGRVIPSKKIYTRKEKVREPGGADEEGSSRYPYMPHPVHTYTTLAS